MSNKEIIQAILAKHPEITEPQILIEFEKEKRKMGGLVADVTLLRVLAARHGVAVSQEAATDCKLLIKHLVPNLNRITVCGRVVAAFPVKTFEGEKPGKYASLLIADKNGILRVMLWNEKADLVESGAVKVGQIARFSRGYTREDRNGKTELHINEKSDVEVDPAGLNSEDFSGIAQFSTAIKDIGTSIPIVAIVGKVKAMFSLQEFTRQDSSIGKVLRFFISDSTGEIIVVAWNEKAEKLGRSLRGDSEVRLINAKVRTSSSGGGLEVHVDETTYVDIIAAPGLQ